MSIQRLDQLKNAIDRGMRFESRDKRVRIFKKDDYYYYGYSDGGPTVSLDWENFSAKHVSDWVKVGGLKLIIKKRFISQRLSSYHFCIEEDGMGEVADLFVIPADIDWNDQLKHDIVESILFALAEVYSYAELNGLLDQAWELMQDIHRPGSST